MAIKDDPAIDWRSPQRGSTAYYRCVLDSFYYLLRRKGLSVTKAKQAGFVLRAQMVTLIDNDLRFVPSLRCSTPALGVHASCAKPELKC